MWTKKGSGDKMKTPEEMADIFAAMPSKKKENPFWQFHDSDGQTAGITDRNQSFISDIHGGELCFNNSTATLRKIRDFFRRFYESFNTEAQVLCIGDKDAKVLSDIGIPVLTTGQIGPYSVTVFVLPQDNHTGLSVVSEAFWQRYIAANGIVPVARVHSHHVLDPYQSSVDYSSLNSGSLEIVIGHIFDEPLHICYWLDVPGTDIKVNTFVASEHTEGMVFAVVPHRFNGMKDASAETVPDSSITYDEMCEYGYDWDGMFPLRKEKAMELFSHGMVTVYFLYEDNTEAEVDDPADIEQHDAGGGIFGVHKESWEKYVSRLRN